MTQHHAVPQAKVLLWQPAAHLALLLLLLLLLPLAADGDDALVHFHIDVLRAEAGRISMQLIGILGLNDVLQTVDGRG